MNFQKKKKLLEALRGIPKEYRHLVKQVRPYIPAVAVLINRGAKYIFVFDKVSPNLVPVFPVVYPKVRSVSIVSTPEEFYEFDKEFLGELLIIQNLPLRTERDFLQIENIVLEAVKRGSAIVWGLKKKSQLTELPETLRPDTAIVVSSEGKVLGRLGELKKKKEKEV